jgi:hypothetical protein
VLLKVRFSSRVSYKKEWSCVELEVLGGAEARIWARGNKAKPGFVFLPGANGGEGRGAIGDSLMGQK